MAHFAKLGLGNKVLAVQVVHNNELLVDGVENEQAGIDFLNQLHKTNDVWKQTSYNTQGGVHKLGGTPLRKNFASKGYTYDEARDAFIAPKPLPSFILNETTCIWEAPVAYPDDGKHYKWKEETTSWEDAYDEDGVLLP